jgi:hypothetical protein
MDAVAGEGQDAQFQPVSFLGDRIRDQLKQHPDISGTSVGRWAALSAPGSRRRK